MTKACVAKIVCRVCAFVFLGAIPNGLDNENLTCPRCTAPTCEVEEYFDPPVRKYNAAGQLQE